MRVVPDSSGFRRQLQHDLNAAEAGLEVTIPVEFDVDTAGLRTQLAALDNSRVTIPVDIGDGSEIERLRARLEALDNSRLRLDVEVTGTADAVAELRTVDQLADRLDGRNIRLNIDVDGLAAALTQMAALGAAVTALNALGSGGSGGGLRGLNLGFGGLAGSIAGATQLVVGLGVKLAQVSATAFAIAVGGAAITGAFGAAATAVAVLPAALALVGAPMALLLADTDELKKRVGELSPAFQKLRKDIAGALAAGIAPALETLANNVIPKVRDSVLGLATTMGSLAQETATWLASTEGVNLLNGILTNVKTTIEEMKPGLADIGQGFLLLANQKGAFDVLTTAVNEFGAQFKTNVTDLLADGTLDAAFQGLADMAGIAARGLADMVKNGIELFAAAAPGMNSALESLSKFLNRFDWTSLGKSVGGVFKGLGEALDRVPQETIDKITTGFEKLAQTFQSSDFQTKLTEIIEGIPDAIIWIDRLSQAFVTIGAYVSVGIQSLEKIGRAFDGLVKIVTGAAQTFMTVGRIIGNPWQAWLDRADITKSFEDAGALIREGFGQIKTEFTTPWPSIGDDAAAAAGAAFRKLPPAALAEIDKLGGEISSKTSPEVAKAVEAVGGGSATAAERGMSLVPPAAQSGVAPTAEAVSKGLAPAEKAVTDATTRIKEGLATGFSGLAEPVATALSGVGTTISTEADKWGPLITTSMGKVNIAIDIGFQSTAAAATTGMGTVGTAITTEGDKWGPLITTSMGKVNQAIDIGFQSTAAAATTGMTLVATAITNGALQWSVAVTAGLAACATVVAAGFQAMAAIAANGMAGLQAAIAAGFASALASVSVGMQQIAATAQAGFAQLVAVITAGFAQASAAFTVNWSSIVTATVAAMTAVTIAVQTGMQQIVVATQQGTQQMTQAITNGMNQSVQVVTSGVARMVSVLNSAVGQFRSAGANMGQALADGLNSKAGAVEAAANRLAQAAAAAVRAAAGIHSPSRVFMALGDQMGAGMELGLRDARTGIIREAASIVDGLNAEFSKTDTSAVIGELDELGGNLHARVRAEVASADNPSAHPSSELATQTQILELIASRLGITNSLLGTKAKAPAVFAAQRARNLAELGAF